MTGDVTDRGDRGAWKVFWQAITAAGLPHDRFLVVPGNHDVCCLGVRLFSKYKSRREADLKKAARGLRIGGQPTKFPWVQKPDPRVAIFGVNSNNLGNLSGASNAVGELAFRECVSLASKLHKYAHVPVKIVALHHSPNIPKVATAKRRGQDGMNTVERLAMQVPQDQRRLLRVLCVAQGVRLVVHGHVHMANDRRVNGIRIVGAPATTQPVGTKGGKTLYQFYVYDVQGAGGRVRRKLRTVAV